MYIAHVMSVLAWIIFGLIAGLFTSALDSTPSAGSIIGTVILSILGSILGGLMAATIFNIDLTVFSFQTFFMGALGSVLLLFISRAFRNA